MDNEFLKKLKESLESGKKNNEVTDHINEVSKLAENLSTGKNKEEFEDLVEEVLNDDEAFAASSDEYREKLSEFEIEDEKNSILADISNLYHDIDKIELEKEELLKQIENRKNEYIEKFGEFPE